MRSCARLFFPAQQCSRRNTEQYKIEFMASTRSNMTLEEARFFRDTVEGRTIWHCDRLEKVIESAPILAVLVWLGTWRKSWPPSVKLHKNMALDGISKSCAQKMKSD